MFASIKFGNPNQVVSTVQQILHKKHPKKIYNVGMDSKILHIFPSLFFMNMLKMMPLKKKITHRLDWKTECAVFDSYMDHQYQANYKKNARFNQQFQQSFLTAVQPNQSKVINN